MPAAMIDGVNLFYERTGAGGEPLVLVHGSWTDHHNWDAVVPALSQTFRVLSYDRRGHGRSERAPGQGLARQDMADLADLITRLDLAPAHVVGHSFGGSVVLRLAAEHPELFRSLTVHEPPLLDLLANDPATSSLYKETVRRIQEVAEDLEHGDLAGAACRFVDTVAFGPGAWEHFPPPVQRSFIRNAPPFLDQVRDPDAFAIDLTRLARFPHPILLTQGDHSPPFLPPTMATLRAAMPRAEAWMLTGAGHTPQVSHPTAYVELIADFIRDQAGSG
jgi:pimeloyl-ACP methyl ester carboxylesterase